MQAEVAAAQEQMVSLKHLNSPSVLGFSRAFENLACLLLVEVMESLKSIRPVFCFLRKFPVFGVAPGPQEDAVRGAQQMAMENAAEARKEIQDEEELQEAEALAAEQRAVDAEEETALIKESIAKLKEEERELRQMVSQTQQALWEQSSFCPHKAQPT